jgi:phage-related protein
VQWDKFKTSISELGITIGSTLLPAVTDILETVTPVITAFSDWAGEHPFLIKVGLGLTAGMLGMRMAVLGVRLAFNLLGRAMLTNPIGIIIGVIILAASLIIEYWGPIKGFFTGLWGSIKRETIRAWNWIKASIFSIWNSVSGWFRARWNDIKEAFSGGIGGVAKLILDWSPLGLFYKAFAGVMSYFGIDMPKSFSEFGANLIGGLVDGVKAKFTAAKDAIVGFGKDIAGWFKSALGISSPSKVFAGFGDNIAVGAAMGVTRSAPAASRASAGMAADMAASAASQRINAARAGSPGGTTAAAGGAGMSIKFSPTINVQGGGSGIKEQVTEALKMSMHELEQMMARVAARQARTAY